MPGIESEFEPTCKFELVRIEAGGAVIRGTDDSGTHFTLTLPPLICSELAVELEDCTSDQRTLQGCVNDQDPIARIVGMSPPRDRLQHDNS